MGGFNVAAGQRGVSDSSECPPSCFRFHCIYDSQHQMRDGKCPLADSLFIFDLPS